MSVKLADRRLARDLQLDTVDSIHDTRKKLPNKHGPKAFAQVQNDRVGERSGHRSEKKKWGGGVLTIGVLVPL